MSQDENQIFLLTMVAYNVGVVAAPSPLQIAPVEERSTGTLFIAAACPYLVNTTKYLLFTSVG